jgi:hypothetical protein
MNWWRTHIWQWIVLAFVLMLVGALVLRGLAASLVEVVGFFLFLAACIRGAGLAVRDNPVSSHGAFRLRGFATQIAIESSARRRAKARRSSQS